MKGFGTFSLVGNGFNRAVTERLLELISQTAECASQNALTMLQFAGLKAEESRPSGTPTVWATGAPPRRFRRYGDIRVAL